MKKNSVFISIIFLCLGIQVLICDQSIEQQVSEKISSSVEDEQDLNDEKLLQEILEIFSLSYKNMVDIAAVYFCGLSVSQDKLYEQIIMQLSRDLFTIIKLFAWYVPVMLKDPKLKKKEKLKKSLYVVSTTVIFWYIFSEILFKNSNNSSSPVTRGLRLHEYDQKDSSQELLMPRSRPK